MFKQHESLHGGAFGSTEKGLRSQNPQPRIYRKDSLSDCIFACGAARPFIFILISNNLTKLEHLNYSVWVMLYTLLIYITIQMNSFFTLTGIQCGLVWHRRQSEVARPVCRSAKCLWLRHHVRRNIQGSCGEGESDQMHTVNFCWITWHYFTTFFCFRTRRYIHKMVSCTCLREIGGSKKCRNGYRRLPRGRFKIVKQQRLMSADIAISQIDSIGTTSYWRQRSASTIRLSNGSTQMATYTASRPT